MSSKDKQITELKDAKKIGEGYEGDVYLSKDKKMIIKIMHIPDEQVEKNTKYTIWREIEFAKFASKYPQFFTTLVAHRIHSNCDYQKKKPDWVGDKEYDKWKAQ